MNPCTPPNLLKEAIYVLPTHIALASPIEHLGYILQPFI